MSMINLSYRKVGGLHFMKIGRLTFMICLSRQYKSLHAVSAKAKAAHTTRVNSAPLLLTYSPE